jgi:hypothetical protein
VAGILELAELPQHHCMAEVKVGARWVDTELDAKGSSQSELAVQAVARDHVGGPGPKAIEVGGGHRIRDATSADARPRL